MNLKVQALKNVGSSWAGLVVNIAVGFFLSPFILHRLGDDAFGLWVLIYSITGYYGLFDFGIRSSIVRYVSKYTALNDSEELNHIINTSLITYSCVAALLLALTGVGTLYVDRLFHIPALFHATAQVIFLMVGFALSLGFPLSIFGGVLEGLQKFYILNVTQIISTLLRAVLIIVALSYGGGLVSVAAITVALPFLAGVTYCVIVLRILPLRFGRRFVDKKSFREVVNYGALTFMILVASRLRNRADAVIIGSLLSAAAITYFTFGARLVDYAADVVTSLAQIFTPLASHYYSTNDFQKLRRVFILGNRACALVMLPICTTLILLGKSVIRVWVGPRYVSSYTILLIILIPATLYGIQAASNRILFGMSKHRSLAIVVLMEGIANVGLSVYLVREIGIVGDALGTAVPMLCTSVFFLPRHMCRVLQVPLRRYLRESYLLPLMMCIPLTLTLWLMQRWFQVHNYFQLLLQVGAGGVVYGACLLWFFLTHEAEGVQLRARVVRWIRPGAGDFTGPDPDEQLAAGPLPEDSETAQSWMSEPVKALGRYALPARVLNAHRNYVRLGGSAARIYLWLRFMDFLGLHRQSKRELPHGARSFVFVCYGNIMRSPMCEALFRRALTGCAAAEDCSVSSAGLHAVPGREAHPWAVVAADELGVSLAEHRAKILTTEMVRSADAIFAMDFQNKAELLALYPEARTKIFMLGAYADTSFQRAEIPDPYYGEENATRLCYTLLESCIRNLMNELFPANGRGPESAGVLTKTRV